MILEKRKCSIFLEKVQQSGHEYRSIVFCKSKKNYGPDNLIEKLRYESKLDPNNIYLLVPYHREIIKHFFSTPFLEPHELIG